MSVVLITGSCGLVGSESTKFFCEKGFVVVGIDNNYYACNHQLIQVFTACSRQRLRVFN